MLTQDCLRRLWPRAPASTVAAIARVADNVFASTGGSIHLRINNNTISTQDASNFLSSGGMGILNATAIPAGGSTSIGYCFSSTSNYGVFFGSGAPTLSAAKGSLYLRSDGSTTNDRMYVNTNGSTTWTAVITAA